MDQAIFSAPTLWEHRATRTETQVTYQQVVAGADECAGTLRQGRRRNAVSSVRHSRHRIPTVHHVVPTSHERRVARQQKADERCHFVSAPESSEGVLADE